MAYTVNRVYRCKERTGGGRMEGGGAGVGGGRMEGGGDRMGGGVAGLVVVEWRGGVIECGGWGLQGSWW